MLNFLKIDRLLTKSFTKTSQERKETQGSSPKNFLLEEAPQEKTPKDMEELPGLQKLYLPLKGYMEEHF